MLSASPTMTNKMGRASLILSLTEIIMIKIIDIQMIFSSSAIAL